MSDHQDQEHAERAKVQRAERSVAPDKAAERPGGAPTASLPADPRSLLADARVRGRGNDPVRIALMREMQQTYGNRAVQRYLRQAEAPHDTAQAAAPVQTQQAVAPA